MISYLDDAQVELMTVDFFRKLGYEYLHGPVIAPEGEVSEPKMETKNR